MSATLFIAVLFAAFFHASWNADTAGQTILIIHINNDTAADFTVQ